MEVLTVRQGNLCGPAIFAGDGAEYAAVDEPAAVTIGHDRRATTAFRIGQEQALVTDGIATVAEPEPIIDRPHLPAQAAFARAQRQHLCCGFL